MTTLFGLGPSLRGKLKPKMWRLEAQYSSKDQKRSNDVSELGLGHQASLQNQIQSHEVYKSLGIKCQKTETPASLDLMMSPESVTVLHCHTIRTDLQRMGLSLVTRAKLAMCEPPLKSVRLESGNHTHTHTHFVFNRFIWFVRTA
jgi:hypothetical protein